VTVYDGLSTSSKVLLGQKCVKEEDEEMKVTSSGKTLLIVLETGPKKDEGAGISDFEHHYRGFSANVDMPGAPVRPPTTTSTLGNIATSPPSPNPAAVSGVVIGTIVGLVVLVFGILVFIAFVHWRRQNHRFNIRLRDSDSDSNTLISSADFEEEPDLKTQKKKGKIVRVTENDLRQAGVYEL
jgi:hypothetical protein